jgi:site-specific DNA-methyltransferase (adenine-specific)
MTKYFHREKSVSEPFICHNCKQEKKDTKWFKDLKKEEGAICLVCYKKWHNQNRRPRLEEKGKISKKQSVFIGKANNGSLISTSHKNEVNGSNSDDYFKSKGVVKNPTLCFVCKETKNNVEFFEDFQQRANKRRSSFCKDCSESRIGYYQGRKSGVVRKKEIFSETKKKKFVEKEKIMEKNDAEKYFLDIRAQSALDKDSLPKESINLIITSPPYNVGIDYGSNGDNLTYEEYLNFSETWLKNCYCWTKPTGRLCLNIPLDKNKNGKNSVCADITTIAKKVGWKYQTTIVWNEGNISRRTAWGSWMSASAPYIIAPVEVIVVFYKEEWKRNLAGTSDITNEEFIEWTNGLWTFPGENSKNVNHPAPFPRELPRRCIKLFSFVDDVVLDPFAGSGTTLIEAINNKRYAWGLEIDPEYIKNGKARIVKECSFNSGIPVVMVQKSIDL